MKSCEENKDDSGKKESAKLSEDGEFIHTPGPQKVNLTQINI